VVERTLHQVLSQERRLLAPIINLSGSPLAREDYFATSPSQFALQESFEHARTILRRIAELPPVKAQAEEPALLALAFAYTRDCAIEARIDPNRREVVDYPLLRGIANVQAILTELSHAHLLKPRFFQRLNTCPACGSARLLLREECSVCRSPDLTEESLVHHYRCGFQGPKSTFIDESALICPKCTRGLRHYGVDYDTPGPIQRCNACGHTQSEPVVGFLCADCTSHGETDTLHPRDWYHYDLLPAAIEALSTGVLPYRSLERVMRQRYGAFAVRDFVSTARVVRRVATRYDRPVTGFQLTVTNMAALGERYGGQTLAAVLSRLGEIVSQLLRESDLVTATDHALFVLLPETTIAGATPVIERIREGTRTHIAAPIEIEVETFTRAELDAMLTRLS
jgi:hypothetical protein